jgi:hypothetical protein
MGFALTETSTLKARRTDEHDCYFATDVAELSNELTESQIDDERPLRFKSSQA